jgi:hypothetical protein
MAVSDEVAQEAERFFLVAAQVAGANLTLAALEKGTTYINERDYLQPVFRTALEGVCADAGCQALVSPSLEHGLSHMWPKLGKFDISLQWHGTAVYGELKAGSDARAMSACAWDALKCAFCLHHKVGAAMLLVGAAPDALWTPHTLGTELFGCTLWDTLEVRDRYEAGFRTWERDGYRPIRVPRRFATRKIGRAEFSVADTPWVIGIARVEPFGRESVTWAPFIEPT